jgi:MFS family permease
VAALISYPAGFLSDKWGRRNILIVALLIFFVAYIGFAFSRNIALIAALFAGYGLYQGSSGPSARRLLRTSCPTACGQAGSAGTIPRWGS